MNILACKLALVTRAHDFLNRQRDISTWGACLHTATPAGSALSIKIGSLAVRIDRRASAWDKVELGLVDRVGRLEAALVERIARLEVATEGFIKPQSTPQ